MAVALCILDLPGWNVERSGTGAEAGPAVAATESLSSFRSIFVAANSTLRVVTLLRRLVSRTF